jgi:two-component system cell cycle response regulator
VNDRHGHAAGDAVLSSVAKRLRAVLRPQDLLARLGGEEFLVALQDTDAATALHCAERLREAIGGSPISIDGPARAIAVTMSVGLTITEQSGDPAEQLIQKADMALYGSKSDGRNLVTLSASAA